MSTPPAVWLPEPTASDETYARRGEHTLDWLARSTLALAKEYRRFLNENLSALPLETQSSVLAALRERWQSALFELIVARILQELGAVIAVEAPTSLGKRPDFIGEFQDGRVTVEAVSPVFDATVSEEANWRIPLLDVIESYIPDGWHVAVWELPRIGPADSKKVFERTIATMLAIEPPKEGSSVFDLVQHLPSGVIPLQLWPNSTGVQDQQLAVEPPLSAWDNSEQRIRYAVKNKRRQVRSTIAPVLLAIQASGMGSDYEAFDKALYGRSFERLNSFGEVADRGLLADGEFTKKREGEPTYAGVLAFLHANPIKVTGPVLYLHPRFRGTLPEAFSALSRCWYDSNTRSIQREPATNSDFLSRLRFAKLLR